MIQIRPVSDLINKFTNIKRVLIISLLFISLILSACDKGGQGTYYPNSDEMKINLENKNYNVTVEVIEQNGSSITVLSATKDNEYIEFYWLEDDKCVDEIAAGLESKYDAYNSLVSMKNDNKFGNLVFCSTQKAKEDSGIVIVEVKID